MTTERAGGNTASIVPLCSRCGTPFRCGALAGDARCWCAALPLLPLARLRPDDGCLCPACLDAQGRGDHEAP